VNDLYLTTAGHCFPIGTTVSDGAGRPIGTVVDALDGHNTDADAEIISLPFSALATNQIIAQAISIWRNVTDEARTFVEGTPVCFSGQTSNGQKCALNAEIGNIIFPDGSVHHDAAIAFNPFIHVDDYSLSGDSGSAVYRSLSNNSLRVYGINDGSTYIEDQNGTIEAGGFYYTFDTHLHNDFGVSALTTPVP
jgi:hypothetical protein